MNELDDLEYLMNPVLYDKYKQISTKEDNLEFLKDKKFYRKRIQHIAKECSKYGIVKDVEKPDASLLNAFDNFARHCIEYFKMIDESEIYQDEYSDMKSIDNTDTNHKDSHPEIINDLNTDFLMSGEKKIVSMDDFITKKKGKISTKPIHLPKQKTVDVTQDKYRVKGVKKYKLKENKSNVSIDGLEKGNV